MGWAPVRGTWAYSLGSTHIELYLGLESLSLKLVGLILITVVVVVVVEGMTDTILQVITRKVFYITISIGQITDYNNHHHHDNRKHMRCY